MAYYSERDARDVPPNARASRGRGTRRGPFSFPPLPGVEVARVGGRNPRRSHRRDVLWRRVKAMGQPCHICGLPIDPSLKARHPLSFELDELVPVSKGGRADVIENVGSSHRCCNQWRGAKSMRQVESIRAEALRRFGAWRSPLEFVQRARAASKGARSLAPMRRPDGLPTSRDW